MADNLSITNLNGVTEDEDTTCGIERYELLGQKMKIRLAVSRL